MLCNAKTGLLTVFGAAPDCEASLPGTGSTATTTNTADAATGGSTAAVPLYDEAAQTCNGLVNQTVAVASSSEVRLSSMLCSICSILYYSVHTQCEAVRQCLLEPSHIADQLTPMVRYCFLHVVSMFSIAVD
jgi:hypothetical protein